MVGKKRKKNRRKSLLSSALSEVRKSFITFGMVSLGCPKNQVDSEKIAANMLEAGFALCEDEASADVVVINTCSFIAPAREESHSAIREFAALRRKGEVKALVVAGCMAQQEGAKLLEQFEEIDAVVTFSAYPRIAGIVRRFLEEGVRVFEGEREYELGAETGRLILSGPYTAYVRIAEGCSNPCTFCTIPEIRGPFRSKAPEAVLEEAAELTEFGIRELVLIAQDTTAYGLDLGGDISIAGLLKSLDEVEGVGWIRLMYTNPAKVTDELIDTIAQTPSVVKYLDMPVQHVSDRILKKMGRRHSEKATRELVRKLHERIPGLALRTSLIVGFPGETEDDFRRLLEFVREGHFQRLGAFTYSKEKGTPAGRMRRAILAEVASRRYEELMLAQQEVAFEFARSLVGKRVETLVESEYEGGATAFEGRTCMDAPEIDCKALIRSLEVQPGQLVSLKVVDTRGYDLILGDS
jgi:ribosomal protein S12 methylthiotransferase